MFEFIHRSIWTDRYGTPSLLRRLLVEDGARYWRSYALVVGLMAVAAGCTAFSAYLVGYVINRAYLTRDFTTVVGFCVLTVGIFAAKGFANYGQAVMMAGISNAIAAEKQQLMFDKLLVQNLGYFADHPSTVHMTRVTFGATAGPAVLSLLISAAGRDGLCLLGLGAVMVFQEPLMSLIALVVMPPTILVVRKLISRARQAAEDQFASSADMMETIQETLQGLRVIKAFGLEGAMRERVAASAGKMNRSADEIARLSNRSGPLMETLGGVTIALVFFYGGYRVIVTGATPGEFVSFITAFLLAYEPAKRLTRLRLDLTNSLLGLLILYEVMDLAEPERQNESYPDLKTGVGRVEFVDVTFAYKKADPVLRGMSFVAQPGRVTALVGASGGGKSTAISLIMRLFEVGSGSILIDGEDIARVSRRSLRANIAYVGQDVYLFRTSIRDNIAFGRRDATDEEIIAAAKAAHAHDFIMGFSQGYATPVGEHGLALSSGQRQRISIARAVLRNAPIILLDEATAALDNESEFQVQQALANLCVGRTTIVVAHRLNTIMHADRIHVVADGRVIESGRHAELLQSGGSYAAFYRLQFKEEPKPQLKAISSA